MLKPILFNTDMVRAIMDGRKTVTRRIVKPQPPENARLELLGDKRHAMDLSIEIPGPDDHRIYTPPYLPGDILYVRETWRVLRAHRYDANADIVFKAGGVWSRVCFANGGTDSADRDDYDRFIEKWYPTGNWHPSIHMPKEAARLFLRVTDVRVERLQEIMNDPPGPNNQVVREGCKYGCDFIAIWESTVQNQDRDHYGWDANPYVWVIEFVRCEKPEVDT